MAAKLAAGNAHRIWQRMMQQCNRSLSIRVRAQITAGSPDPPLSDPLIRLAFPFSSTASSGALTRCAIARHDGARCASSCWSVGPQRSTAWNLFRTTSRASSRCPTAGLAVAFRLVAQTLSALASLAPSTCSHPGSIGHHAPHLVPRMPHQVGRLFDASCPPPHKGLLSSAARHCPCPTRLAVVRTLDRPFDQPSVPLPLHPPLTKRDPRAFAKRNFFRIHVIQNQRPSSIHDRGLAHLVIPNPSGCLEDERQRQQSRSHGWVPLLILACQLMRKCRIERLMPVQAEKRPTVSPFDSFSPSALVAPITRLVVATVMGASSFHLSRAFLLISPPLA